MNWRDRRLICSKTHQLITTLNTLEKDLKTRYPQAQLLSRGTVFYSDYASQQAKQDISTLGVATLLGVILPIVAVFRSLRPLLLCVISIGIGALAGTVATLLIFGELHPDDAGDEHERYRHFR